MPKKRKKIIICVNPELNIIKPLFEEYATFIAFFSNKGKRYIRPTKVITVLKIVSVMINFVLSFK